MSDDFAYPFSVEWATSGDEQLTVDGLRSLVRQLPGAPICRDAEGAQIIGRVTAVAQNGGATLHIRGLTHESVPDGATAAPQYRVRRGAMSGGVLMVSALDAVRVLVTPADAPDHTTPVGVTG